MSTVTGKPKREMRFVETAVAGVMMPSPNEGFGILFLRGQLVTVDEQYAHLLDLWVAPTKQAEPESSLSAGEADDLINQKRELEDKMLRPGKRGRPRKVNIDGNE